MLAEYQITVAGLPKSRAVTNLGMSLCWYLEGFAPWARATFCAATSHCNAYVELRGEVGTFTLPLKVCQNTGRVFRMQFASWIPSLSSDTFPNDLIQYMESNLLFPREGAMFQPASLFVKDFKATAWEGLSDRLDRFCPNWRPHFVSRKRKLDETASSRASSGQRHVLRQSWGWSVEWA